MVPENNGALEDVRQRLADPDESVRRGAVEEWAEFGDEEMVTHLTDLLRTEKNVGVLEAIANVLMQIGGKRTVQELLPHLDSDDAKIRNLVCEIITGIGADSVGLLFEYLVHEDEDIRKFIVDILGDIGKAEATPRLVQRLDDPCINVACSAAESLGKIGHPEAVDPLIRAIHKGNQDLTYYCIVALGKIRNEKSLDFLAANLNCQGDELLCCTMIESLGEIGDRKAIDALRQLLEHPSLVIQKAALKSIGKIDVRYLEDIFREKQTDPLIKCLLSSLTDADKELKKYALISLGAMNRVIGITEMVELLHTPSELTPFIIQNLVKMGKIDVSFLLPLAEEEGLKELLPTVLGDVQNYGTIDALISFLKDGNPLVRRASARALGKFNEARIVNVLMETLRDEDNTVRSAAADSLGWLKAPEAVPSLSVALEDDFVDVAESAASALVMIGGSEVENLLLAKAAHPKDLVREKVVYALGMLQDNERVRRAMINALQDRNHLVRKSAIKSLSRYSDPSFLELIRPLIRDENASVRMAAVKMLAKIDDHGVVEPLLAMLDDGDIWVKYEAIHALGRFSTEPVTSTLMSLLVQGESLVQIAACESLALLRYMPAAGVLRGLMKASDRDVQEAARKALEKLRSTEQRG